MKRILLRMSALATVIVLGLITIAQAQRSGERAPSPTPAPASVPHQSAAPGFSIPQANPLRSAAPMEGLRSGGAPMIASQPGMPAADHRADASQAESFSFSAATSTGMDPIQATPDGMPLAQAGAGSLPAESPAEFAMPPILPNFGGPPAVVQSAPGTIADPSPSSDLPADRMPVDAGAGFGFGFPLADSYGEPGRIPEPHATQIPQPAQVAAMNSSLGHSLMQSERLDAHQPATAVPSVGPDVHQPATAARPAVTDGRQPATGIGRPGTKNLDGAQSPHLVVEKIAPTEIQVGRPAIFEIHVRNVGQVAASGVEVRDEIPKGTRLQSTRPQAAQGAQGGLVWDVGTLNPNEVMKVEMELMPIEEGEIGSVATVQFRTEASVRARATRPLLAVETSAPDKILKGEEIALKITVSNPGSGVAENVVIEEHVPAGFRHPAGTELEYEVGNLAPGESRELVLTLEAVHAGPLVNVITARGDPNLRVQNQKPIEVIASQLQVAVEGPSRRYLEREAVYNLSVRNPGTAPARQVEMTVELPPGMQFVSGSNQAHYQADTRTVHWLLEEIPVEDGPPPVQLTVMPVEPGQHTLRLVSFDGSGATAEVEQPVFVEGIAALFFEVADMDDPIEVGGQTMYEIRVVNQGSKEATNVQIAADLPPGLLPVAAEGPTRHEIQEGRVLFAPLPRLAPKADTTYRVRVEGVQPGDLRMRVHLVTDEIRTPITKEESTRVYSDH